MIEEYVKSIDKLRYQNRSLISNLQSLSNLNSKLVNLTIKLTKESNALDSFANKIGNYYSIDNNPIRKNLLTPSFTKTPRLVSATGRYCSIPASRTCGVCAYKPRKKGN